MRLRGFEQLFHSTLNSSSPAISKKLAHGVNSGNELAKAGFRVRLCVSDRVDSSRLVNRIGILLCGIAQLWMFLDVVESCVLASVLANHGVNIFVSVVRSPSERGARVWPQGQSSRTSSTLVRLFPVSCCVLIRVTAPLWGVGKHEGTR